MAADLETQFYLEGLRFMGSEDKSNLEIHHSIYVLIISNCL